MSTSWDDFDIVLRDFEGTHIVWRDPEGGDHLHTWSNPNESAGFIFRWVEKWRSEHVATVELSRAA